MNVIARLIGALVSGLLTWVGIRLGVEFTPEDHAAATTMAVTIGVGLYGLIHPVVRSRLVAWTGKGARAQDNVTPPVGGGLP